ncbi:1,5-anhydro-D-fructose reductase-like [Haemaphysalis longicornis]
MSKNILSPSTKKVRKPAPATTAKPSKEQRNSSQEPRPSSSCDHTDTSMPPCVFRVDSAGRTIRNCVLMNNGVWMPMVGLSICKPGILTGADDTDVDDWLNLFERVSAHNRWDPTIMLANVIFYLKEESPARKWFETNDTELSSWEVFKTKLREGFGKPLGRQVAARKELASRAQTSTESYVTYIQDVLALCSKADSTMPEADKGDTAHIEKIVEDAVLSGYRHIDTAHASHNETAIGNALQRMMASGKVKRDELFVVTKGMEDAANLGMTRSIGLCNFNKTQISRILDMAMIKPANLQIECHAYLDQKDLLKFCKQHSICVTAYAPLGSPADSGASSPHGESWHTHSTLLQNSTLRKVADRYKKTPAQVLIRWLLQRGIVPLPRSTSPAHIQENIQVFDFELSKADIDTLIGLNKNQRLFTYDVYGIPNRTEYPFK